jgi:CBS domain-containing protein
MTASEEGRRQRAASLAYLNQLQTHVRQQAEQRGIQIRCAVLSGQHEAEVILNYSKEQQCDLLVLGASGREYPWHSPISETARRVANEAACAVMLVRSSALQRPVRKIMTSTVARVTKLTPLSEVVSYLIERGVKLLPVVSDEQRVLGVITLGYLLTHDQTFRRLDLQRVTSTEHLGQYVRRLFTAEKTAGDVMRRRPLVVRDDDTLESAAQRMVAQNVTRMPVVNAEGKLVGMLDQADILRSYTDLPQTSDMGPGGDMQQASPPQQVGEAVLSHVPLVALGTPLPEVLHQVQQTPLRRVIVIDSDGKAVGVIADLDILASRGLAVRRNPILALAGRFSLRVPEDLFGRRSSSGPLTAQQVMRPRLFAVTPTTPAAEAVRLMLAHGIKRLVVVDERGRPLGLVDRQQLLRSLLGGPPSKE